MSHSQRYDEASALALWDEDVLRLGRRADDYRRRLGVEDSLRITRHLNYTNICRYRCRFCRFCRRSHDADAYTHTPDELLEQAAAAVAAGAKVLHIVGGVHPELSYAYYVGLLRVMRQAFPEVHLRAFTATEIIDLAAKRPGSVEAVLAELMDAGLNSLPGGGAEILDENYFARHAPDKPGPDAWLNVHAAAHRLNLSTNATMLFGFRETLLQRTRHLLRLRALQDASLAAGRGAFAAFVPLPWIDAAGKPPGGRAEGFAELKTIAVSRLVLDNFPHVKAFTPLLGRGLAETALHFGADELETPLDNYLITNR
ncbi:MAG: radical SAM protein [Sedimentisphaerales bacterium]|nr:radical SAM protein [Sedimentisphaerales bacterium]